VQGVTVAGFRCEALATTVAVAIGRETATTADGRAAAVPSRAAAPESARFGMLMDIDLPLVVRFGCTDMSLKALSRLGPGSLIDLSRAPEDPVEVLVGGRVVARGEVVVVSGSYGIRIVDVSEGRSQALGMEA
jgi:flagellar motor switch protein FliN/FliY